MARYKNTKLNVILQDGDGDFFGIFAGVLQGNTLAPYQFIICLDNVLQMSTALWKEYGFKQTWPAKTIKDAN